MNRAKRLPARHPRRICESCDAIAVGTITFYTGDGPRGFAACQACSTDALIHSRTRVRFRSWRTWAEISRGMPRDAA